MKLNPEVSKDRQKSSIVMIIFQHCNDNFIVVDEKSEYLNNYKSTICLFFPQLYEIFYLQLKDQKDKGESLQKFTRSQLMAKKWSYCDLNQAKFLFKTFDEKQETVLSTSQVSWYSRLKVQLLQQISSKLPENDVIIRISIGLNNDIQVSFNKFKKFRLNQLYIYHKLDKYRYTSLMINDVIIRHYQSLENLNLFPKIHQAFPMFTFQLFYQQAQETYEKMHMKNVDFSALMQELVDNQYEIQYLKQLYNKFKRQDIDEIALHTIIYLTSPFYKSSKQRKFLTDYFHGNIGPPEDNKQFQLMCLMLNSLSKCCKGIDNSAIFISEKVDGDSQESFVVGQFVRIRTFTPAVRQLSSLKLDPQQNYFVFEIEHVSAKHVSLYNGEQNEFSHIIIPYNEYYVSEIKSMDRIIYVKLFQLPTPKQLRSGLLIWIEEGIQPTKMLKINEMLPNLQNFQVMLIKNIKLYEIWLQKYYVLTTSRNMCIVYKKPSQSEILTVVRLTKKYLGQDKEIMVYIQDQQQMLLSIKVQQVKVTNNKSHIIQHICERFSKPPQQKEMCQQCDCDIY